MIRKLRGVKPSQIKRQKAKLILSGPAGVGKTTFACQFPDVHLIDTEGGATNPQYVATLEKSGASYMGPAEGADDYATVIEEVQTLAMTKHDRKTLVIDSFSKMFHQAIAQEEERLSAAGEKIAFGNEKKPAVKLTRRLITWLGKLDMNVVLICHEKANWLNGEQAGWTWDGWDKLGYELDLVLRMTKEGPERVGIVTKSRLEGFPDGQRFPFTYDEFARRFGRSDIEGEVVSLKPATDKQVETLNTLLDSVKIDSAIVPKWLEKAGVDTFAEMDSDTIQACIDFLKRKVGA